MKELFLNWMMDLTLFSFLSSICVKLLPGKGYAPYMKLFTGIVLLLIFISPLLEYADLDETIAGQMDQYMEETKLSLMEEKLFEVEEKQRKQIEEAWERNSNNMGE